MYHLWKKDIVSWRIKHYLYLSIPFTWLIPKAKDMAKLYKGTVFIGGPATKLIKCDFGQTLEDHPFDILSLHNPLATFTTRGCIRNCYFCAVPRTEGEFIELKVWKPNPIICDNNLLASSKSHFKKVIDSLVPFRYIDFNQGLDAALFTSWHADQIGRLRGAKMRFSFDHVNFESQVLDAISLCLKKGLRDIGVYVLIGFEDTPEDALYRLEKIRKLGIRPNPMRYQPLDALIKNQYVDLNWSEKELLRIMNYYSRLRWFEDIPFDEFDNVIPTSRKQENLFK